MTDLPKTLHALLGLAIEDVKLFRASGHRIDLNVWFEQPINGDEDQQCAACLAGAVMWSGRFDDLKVIPDPPNISGRLHTFTSHYLDDGKSLFNALDMLRLGHIVDAVWFFYDEEEEINDPGILALGEKFCGHKTLLRAAEPGRLPLHDPAFFQQWLAVVEELHADLKSLNL